MFSISEALAHYQKKFFFVLTQLKCRADELVRHRNDLII